MSLYVYAVRTAPDEETLALDGVFEKPVYHVRSGALAAIVSDCPAEVVRAERKHIIASQRVISAANAQADVLPMAFGTIAESEEEIGHFLNEHQAALAEQLERVTGSVEMALKLNLDTPDPIAYLVERTPALQAARRRAFARGHAPSYDERVRLGQLCDQVLRNYRDTLTAQVTQMIAPTCRDIMTLPVHDERELAHLAVLVSRTDLETFQAVVEASADQFDDDLAFSIHGPWPAHNFVGVRQAMSEAVSVRRC